MKVIAACILLLVLVATTWNWWSITNSEPAMEQHVGFEEKVATVPAKSDGVNSAMAVVPQPTPKNAELQSIGDFIDPEGDPNVGRVASELISIGDFLDPEADPNIGRDPGPVREIGEFIDPEADPNIGRDPGPVIEIGDFIDAEEYFYGTSEGAIEPIELGEVLDPEQENQR
jgi:hypothetical protein